MIDVLLQFLYISQKKATLKWLSLCYSNFNVFCLRFQPVLQELNSRLGPKHSLNISNQQMRNLQRMCSKVQHFQSGDTFATIHPKKSHARKIIIVGKPFRYGNGYSLAYISRMLDLNHYSQRNGCICIGLPMAWVVEPAEGALTGQDGFSLAICCWCPLPPSHGRPASADLPPSYPFPQSNKFGQIRLTQLVGNFRLI